MRRFRLTQRRAAGPTGKLGPDLGHRQQRAGDALVPLGDGREEPIRLGSRAAEKSGDARWRVAFEPPEPQEKRACADYGRRASGGPEVLGREPIGLRGGGEEEKRRCGRPGRSFEPGVDGRRSDQMRGAGPGKRERALHVREAGEREPDVGAEAAPTVREGEADERLPRLHRVLMDVPNHADEPLLVGRAHGLDRAAEKPPDRALARVRCSRVPGERRLEPPPCPRRRHLGDDVEVRVHDAVGEERLAERGGETGEELVAIPVAVDEAKPHPRAGGEVVDFHQREGTTRVRHSGDPGRGSRRGRSRSHAYTRTARSRAAWARRAPTPQVRRLCLIYGLLRTEKGPGESVPSHPHVAPGSCPPRAAGACPRVRRLLPPLAAADVFLHNFCSRQGSPPGRIRATLETSWPRRGAAASWGPVAAPSLGQAPVAGRRAAPDAADVRSA